MAGVNNLVTRGYGSFATVNDVVTAGYASGDSSIISDADAAKIASYVWREILEDGKEAQELMRGFAAALLAKASGLDGFAPQYRDLADSKNRIDAQTDKYGNRTSVDLDLT